MSVVVAFDEGTLVSQLHTYAQVETIEYVATGTRVKALVPEWLAARLEEYREAATEAP